MFVVATEQRRTEHGQSPSIVLINGIMVKEMWPFLINLLLKIFIQIKKY